MSKKLWRWALRLPWWLKLAAVVAAPVCALNLAVAWLGSTQVFPLSPFFLREKAIAVGKYAKHRPTCVLDAHDDLPQWVERASRRHKLPPGLLAAIVEVESNGRPHRISFAGAMGPGQLMPDTALLMNVKDPFDPEEALDGSARYLAQQLARYRNIKLAVAAYNAGPGNVTRFVPQNGETEHYVRKVMAEYDKRRPKPKPKPVGRPRPKTR